MTQRCITSLDDSASFFYGSHNNRFITLNEMSLYSVFIMKIRDNDITVCLILKFELYIPSAVSSRTNDNVAPPIANIRYSLRDYESMTGFHILTAPADVK